ncbi:MAG TPA: DUF6130 family protein [Humisphaera sp.]
MNVKRTLLTAAAAAGLAGTVAAVTATSRPVAAESAPPPPRTAREVRGATPYFPVENEPPPRLIVDDPRPELLDKGVVWIQYRTENLRIVPVFGEAAARLSPRVGHLHVRVDDLPWWWADPSDTNTVDIANVPPGEHAVLIELVDADHRPFPGQSRRVTFTVPGTPPAAAAIAAGTLPPGYRDWRLISVAREEGDLDDIRAVLGNDAAIKAYRSGTQPFPDGTVIARVAWSYNSSAENNKTFGRAQSFVAGHPKNGVQFMVKDSVKYASTGGWGYSQFDDGKPLTDPAKLRSCYDCHQAIKGRDFVFTKYAR